MSIVIAKKLKDKIIIGSDTQESTTDGIKINIKGFKIKSFNEGVYIGSAGFGAAISLLHSYVEINSMKSISSNYQINEYFSEFYNWTEEITKKVEDKDTIFNGSQHIIIIGNKIWEYSNHYVRELQEGELIAIGSGTSHALGCLSIGHSIEDALIATCRSNLYCSEPIEIFEIKLNETK